MADTKIVNPLVYTIGDKTYTLEFDRNSALSAERMGLYLKDCTEMNTPLTTIPLLFFAAFKWHHPEITRKQTDSILTDELHGLSHEELARLIELFAAPVTTIMRDDESAERKNVTVSL